MQSSRLTRVRSKKDTRLAFVYVLISVLIIVAMITWGVPAAARMAGLFITKDTGIGDTTELRPTPPIFSDIPESTNSAKVALGGFSQPGVEVILVVNGQEYKKILTDDAGVFQFDNVSLTEGENTVHAYAVTSRGTESEQSKEYTVSVDNTKPEIALSSPTDGQVYRGEKDRLATFAGTVNEENTKVYIGDRMAIVQTDGSFHLTYQMIEGDQEIHVKAIDQAGNENEVVVKLRWEP